MTIFAATFFNAGQCYAAGSQSSIEHMCYNEVLSALIRGAHAYPPPLITQEHLDLVGIYLACNEGQIMCGGQREEEHNYMLAPTIVVDDPATSPIICAAQDMDTDVQLACICS